MNKLFIKQKIILVVLGVFLSLLLLEFGLRVGGFVLASFQECRNRISIEQKGSYRIMCLGESTTALGGDNAYPRQLENILNNCNLGVKFSVINKGVNGITTGGILWQLEENLEKYKPDMVISMIGINDTEDTIKYGSSKNSISKSSIPFSLLVKTSKLFNIFWKHVKAKRKEFIQGRIDKEKEDDYDGITNLGNTENFLKQRNQIREGITIDKNISYLLLGESYIEQGKFNEAILIAEKEIKSNPEKYTIYVKLGQQYKIIKEYKEAEEMFLMAIKIIPEQSDAYFELGRFYFSIGAYNKAIDLLKKAIKISPEKYYAYIELGECLCTCVGESNEGEKVFKKAIELNPKNYIAYYRLGFCYFIERHENDKAVKMFEKALSLAPENYDVLVDLGECLRDAFSDFDKAERVLKKAIEINPMKEDAYFELMRCYVDQGKDDEIWEIFKKTLKLNFSSSDAYIDLGYFCDYLEMYEEAEASVKKAMAIDSENKRSFEFLSEHNKKIGKQELAGYYLKKMVEDSEYRIITVYNYLKLYEILAPKGVKLVSVQYPIRNVKSLQDIFNKNKNIIFVDNEYLFKDAIKKDNYNKYFIDSFAGDFGHCTPLGNWMLAENIAQMIIKEHFKN